MKKFHLKPKKIWKSKKRHSFHLYFILFATIIVTVSTTFPSGVYAIIHQVTGKSSTFPEIIIVTVSSLLVGALLSFFIGCNEGSPLSEGILFYYSKVTIKKCLFHIISLLKKYT